MPNAASPKKISIRPGQASDATTLTELSLRSKAHWPYSKEFIQLCRDDLTITPEMASGGRLFVANDGDRMIGFFAFEPQDHPAELSHFFIDAPEIGAGYGTALWLAALKFAQQHPWEWFQICSDPYAEAFYLSKGCKQVGEYESRVIEGRMLPLLRFDLKNKVEPAIASPGDSRQT